MMAEGGVFGRGSREETATVADEGSAELTDLNAHVGLEYNAAHFYRYAAAKLGSHDVALKSIAGYFAGQSKEEFSHADEHIEYLTLRGFDYQPSPIVIATERVDSTADPEALVKEIFALSLVLERAVYESFLKLSRSRDVSLSDYGTEWLRKQEKEIFDLKSVISRYEICARHPNLYLFECSFQS